MPNHGVSRGSIRVLQHSETVSETDPSIWFGTVFCKAECVTRMVQQLGTNLATTLEDLAGPRFVYSIMVHVGLAHPGFANSSMMHVSSHRFSPRLKVNDGRWCSSGNVRSWYLLGSDQ